MEEKMSARGYEEPLYTGARGPRLSGAAALRRTEEVKSARGYSDPHVTGA